jgi:hypothetical protein
MDPFLALIVEVFLASLASHYAEYAGYWETTGFLKEHNMKTVMENGEITFYDSNTGKPLFFAPRGRTFDQFVAESKSHGWPSFRDEEVSMCWVECPLSFVFEESCLYCSCLPSSSPAFHLTSC